jgi:putative transposase
MAAQRRRPAQLDGSSSPAARCGSGPAQVLAYRARYTHRVAIANSRLVSVTDAEVAFRWKDYRDHSETKLMTLAADEFIRPAAHLPDDDLGRLRVRAARAIAGGRSALGR